MWFFLPLYLTTKAWSIVLTDLPWLLGKDKRRIEREEISTYERKKQTVSRIPEKDKPTNPVDNSVISRERRSFWWRNNLFHSLREDLGETKSFLVAGKLVKDYFFKYSSKVYSELNEAWKLILHQPMLLNQVYFAFILEAMKCLKPLDTKRVRCFNSIE